MTEDKEVVGFYIVTDEKAVEMMRQGVTGNPPQPHDTWPWAREDDEFEGDLDTSGLTFMLFAGDYYYPRGGTDDYIGGYPTIGEAKKAMSDDGHEWGQIVVFKDGTFHQLLDWEEWELDKENQKRVRGWRRV